MKKPLTLIIMDGFGINPDTYGNAIEAAATPNLSKIFAENRFRHGRGSARRPDGQ